MEKGSAAIQAGAGNCFTKTPTDTRQRLAAMRRKRDVDRAPGPRSRHARPAQDCSWIGRTEHPTMRATALH